MNHKTLGATEVRLPELGLGTWKYGGGVEPLREGIACGVSFVDTAESYSTEEIVGEAIRGIRDKVFVATKVSPRNFRRPDLLRAADASLKRLGTDHIAVSYTHLTLPTN